MDARRLRISPTRGASGVTEFIDETKVVVVEEGVFTR
jgi:hypothetical protein